MAKQRRALVPTGMLILAVLGGVNYFFAPADSTAVPGGTGSGGSAGGVQQNPIRPRSPQETVRAVYHYIAAHNPSLACAMFLPDGQLPFASDLHGANCQDAAAKVTNTAGYDTAVVPEAAVTTSGATSTVDSCQMTIAGGQRLGVFTLTKQPDLSWAITGHAPSNPPDCLTG
ncbi:hypothetical protein [Kutzneria albida]|nr:hypothetical protein [Kutzneria albida]